MALIFHDGKNKVLSGYNDRRWDDLNGIGFVGALGRYNTESNIKKLIADYKPTYSYELAKSKRLVTVDFCEIMNASGGVNAFVVKGIHQLGVGFLATPHLSIAFDGWIYHIDFVADVTGIKGVIKVSRGNRYEDPEGFT